MILEGDPVFGWKDEDLFSFDEFVQILIAWFFISVAFSFSFNISLFLARLPIIMAAVGTGFIFHELAHKFVAMYYGAYARFILWPQGLVFSLFLAIMTGGHFIFAAPGAVYIFQHLSRKEDGIVSLAGPFVNFFIAGLSLVAAFLWNPVFFTIFYVNVFLGTFNLLPIPPLDGFKVFLWNKWIWGIFFIPGALFVMFF